MKYLEAVFDRYRKASKESKGRILDEFCKVCGYNRKYAIWKLRQGQVERKPRERIRRKRGRIYDCKVTAILEEIWRAANYPWSVRLKEIARLWLP
jgi:hypothetical protein